MCFLLSVSLSFWYDDALHREALHTVAGVGFYAAKIVIFTQITAVMPAVCAKWRVRMVADMPVFYKTADKQSWRNRVAALSRHDYSIRTPP
jgi:hypothetical protein